MEEKEIQKLDEEKEQSGTERKVKAVSIASIAVSIVGIVLSIVALAFCIQSFVLGANSQNNAGDGIGAVFFILFTFIFAAPSTLIGVISLWLGILSVVKAQDKSTKSKGVIGTVLSALSIVVCVLVMILRLTIGA